MVCVQSNLSAEMTRKGIFAQSHHARCNNSVKHAALGVQKHPNCTYHCRKFTMSPEKQHPMNRNVKIDLYIDF